MGIRHWHGGKIVLVWLLGVASAWAGFFAGIGLAELGYVHEYAGAALAVAAVAIVFFGCVTITWRWLSGRER